MIKNLLIWVAAITLSSASGAAAFGAIAKNKAPELAVSLFPTNGFAAEAAAAGLVKAFVAKNRGEFPNQLNPSWNALALQAFESEPVTPDAITVIALSRSGNVRRGLMQKAFELSRRQQLVTGWLIIDSGLRDDIASILTYYDTILRTSSSASAALIPVMANALANEKFVEPFATLLATDPPWTGRFWSQTVRTGVAASNAAELRQILYKPNEQNNVYQDDNLIKMLLEQKQFIKAERLYYLLSGTKTKNEIIRNSRFRRESRYPPLDWELVSTGEYGAVISQGQLSLSAVRNSGGLFGRKLVKLPNTILEMKLNLVRSPPDEAYLFLGLSCAETVLDAPRNIRIPLNKKSTISIINNSEAACNYYWLDITGRSAGNGDDFDISIKSISLDSR